MIAKGKELYEGGGKSAQDVLAEQMQQTEEELTQARADYDAYVKQNPHDTVGITTMSEAIQLKERTYASLLDQYDQARLREQLRANIITVVETANLPSSPSKPNVMMNIAFGLVAGLVGGVGLAFLFENLYGHLRTSKQIAAVANLDIIGKIPPMPKKGLFQGKNTWNSPRSPYYEAFRKLRVRFVSQNADSADGKCIKSLLITSAEPGEGKSTITKNLAMSMAQFGKKVIVVDCDLHKPKQHEINGLPNSVGLSSVLSQNVKLDAAVQITAQAGMHVLTSGPLPANPSYLINSPQMRMLVTALTKYYDVVLLDSPAMLVISDTVLLAPLVEGVIFVARRNFIQEDAVREASKQLVDIKARVVGLVVNDAEPNGSYYYYRQR